MKRELFRRNETPALILGILTSLASVRRFDMAIMFMSSTEKKGTIYNFFYLHVYIQISRPPFPSIVDKIMNDSLHIFLIVVFIFSILSSSGTV